jgi:hypothetical protein
MVTWYRGMTLIPIIAREIDERLQRLSHIMSEVAEGTLKSSLLIIIIIFGFGMAKFVVFPTRLSVFLELEVIDLIDT